MDSENIVLRQLYKNNIDFFVGVPDSLLVNFVSQLFDREREAFHITAANEGNAIAIAAGYFLKNRKIPLVYFQNSGIGNAINPLISLAGKNVYSIPMLLIVGWRGEPGTSDEPQHIAQGEILKRQLELLNIPYLHLSNEINFKETLKQAIDLIEIHQSPVAILISKGTFNAPIQSSDGLRGLPFELTRETAVDAILEHANEQDVFVGSTGMISREIHEQTEKFRIQGKNIHSFLSVGAMGHASSIALGIALQEKIRWVWCLDGDGAAIMHMGSMAIIGQSKTENLIHVILNNGAHDSVGGQPTVGLEIDFVQIAKACGYMYAFIVEDAAGLRKAIKKLRKVKGPILLEIRINQGRTKNLGRPQELIPLRQKFMENIS